MGKAALFILVLILPPMTALMAADNSSPEKRECKPVSPIKAAEWQEKRRAEQAAHHPNYGARRQSAPDTQYLQFDTTEVLWTAASPDLTTKAFRKFVYHIPMNHLSPYGDIKTSLMEAETPQVYFFWPKFDGFSQSTWPSGKFDSNAISVRIFHPSSTSTVPTVPSLIRILESAGAPKRNEFNMDVFDYPHPQNGECFPEEIMVAERTSNNPKFIICSARTDYRPFSTCKAIFTNSQYGVDLRVEFHSSLTSSWREIEKGLHSTIGTWRRELP